MSNLVILCRQKWKPLTLFWERILEDDTTQPFDVYRKWDMFFKTHLFTYPWKAKAKGVCVFNDPYPLILIELTTFTKYVILLKTKD